jgi:hypothetical protein
MLRSSYAVNQFRNVFEGNGRNKVDLVSDCREIRDQIYQICRENYIKGFGIQASPSLTFHYNK